MGLRQKAVGKGRSWHGQCLLKVANSARQIVQAFGHHGHIMQRRDLGARIA